MSIQNEEIEIITKRRDKRRQARQEKITKRLKLFEHKAKSGTIFDKHVDKIKSNGGGYMAKHGTVLHYSQGTKTRSGVKTRSRKSYNGTENWSYRDRKNMQD